PLTLQPFEHLADALDPLAIAVVEALLEEAPQRVVDVAVVHEIVGDLAEQIVGVEVESFLCAVPARVAKDGDLAGPTTEERHARSVMPFCGLPRPRSATGHDANASGYAAADF